MNTCLLVAHFNSVGGGLLSTHSVLSDKEVEVLEFFPCGHESYLLARAARERCLSHIKNFRSADVIQTAVIDDCPQEVIDAFYSLSNSNYLENALIFESAFLGELFFYLKKFMELGCSIVDFRWPRYAGAKGYAIVTYRDKKSLDGLNSFFDHTSLKIHFIEDLSSEFRTKYNMP